MALTSKLEAVVDTKSPADKFYNVFKSQLHLCPTASPDNVQGIEVHEGDWETSGSVKLWNYKIDGKDEIFKDKVEVDEAKKKVTFTAVEGHVLDLYKSYKGTFEFAPKEEGGSVKIILEVEKLNADIPTPNNYLQFAVSLLKDIDVHLLKPE